MDSQMLQFKRTVNAPASEAYRAFTRAIALREWLCDVAMADARAGGRLYLWWNTGFYACGEFTAAEPGKAVAFTWHGRGEPGTTQVQVSLAATEGGTEVTLVHSGIGPGEEWAGVRQEIERGWQASLENLQAVLETGRDLRFIRRPMLGVYIGEFNAEIAAKLGVPVTEGMRLEGVVEGMGAQAAGLQKDDVIVGLGGKDATVWPALVAALQSHHAGDTVPVVFYRGGEKKEVAMTLSPRQVPEVPATAEALAEAARQMHAGLAAELEKCFEGVSEAEAAYRPAPKERESTPYVWNALETVAHLIAAERETQTWITDLINDDERWSDRFENPTNVPARVAATVVAFPTLSAIVEAWKRSMAETAAMLAALPPEFVAHKGSFWRLGRDLLQAPDHVHEHSVQIRAAVQSARGQ